MTSAEPVDDRLSFYALAGWLADPRQLNDQIARADELRLGGVWVSEKWDQKEAGVLLGAISQMSRRMRLGVAVTHPHTRHPLVLAALGATLQAVSGGRAVIGLGRGSSSRPWSQMGLADPTTDMLRDAALVLRRLWRGETVSYHGPLGTFPSIRMANPYLGTPPRLVLAASGPQTVALAGSVFDGLLTLPFLTTDAVGHAAARARQAAADAGRDPSDLRVVHPLVVAPGVAPDRQLALVGGRFVRYVQHDGTPGSRVPGLNGWSPEVIAAVRSHTLLAKLQAGNGVAARDDRLAAIAADVVPGEWLRLGAAVGTVAECAERVRAYLAAGVDEVVLHGATPDEFAALVVALREVRDVRGDRPPSGALAAHAAPAGRSTRDEQENG